MSEFLTRLVERARGTAPRVQPLIPSRYSSDPLPELLVEKEVTASSGPTPAPSTLSADARVRSTASVDLETKPPTTLVPAPVLAATDSEALDRLNGIRAHDPIPREPVVRVASAKGAEEAGLLRRREPMQSHQRRAEVADVEEQAPVVHVTIGRIDVRAAPMPGSPVRRVTRPSAPSLTLDAYLQERKAGRT